MNSPEGRSLRGSAPSVEPPHHPQRVRFLRYVALVAVIEAALFFVGYLAPAMQTLLKPVYLLVLAVFVIPIWHATRKRAAGHDRRHADRRHAGPRG